MTEQIDPKDLEKIKIEGVDFDLLDEETSKAIKTVYHQRAQALKKLEGAEEANKKLAADLATATPPKEPPKKEKKEEQSDRFARLEFKQEHPNLDKEDIDLAFRLAGDGDPHGTVSGIYFQSYLKSKADAKVAAAATPGPDNRTGNTPSHKLEDLQDPEKIAKMPLDQFEQLSNELGKGSGLTVVHNS